MEHPNAESFEARSIPLTPGTKEIVDSRKIDSVIQFLEGPRERAAGKTADPGDQYFHCVIMRAPATTVVDDCI